MDGKVVALVASYPIHPNLQAVLFNLGRLLGDEFTFDLIMGAEDPPEQLHGLYNFFRVEPPPIDKARIGYAFKATHKYLRYRHPDVIMNVSHTFPLGPPIVLLGRWHDVPVILRVTNDYFAESEIGDIWKRWMRYIIHTKILNKVYKATDLAVPVGGNLAKKLLVHGFEPNQVHALPQPFDPSLFSPLQADEKLKLKERLGLEPECKIILYVGRLIWAKGADRVFEIADRVHRKSNEYQFCLVGEGDYIDDFRQRFEREEVFCTGFVPRKDVHKYFRVADLLIHPTRRDALPNVILEALAARIPVMATPVGEINNLVTMIYSDTDAFVSRILDGEWHRDSLPERLRWDIQAKNYRELFEAV